MKNVKRSVSVIMTIAMAVSCLTFMPAAGFAEEGGDIGDGSYLPSDGVTEEQPPSITAEAEAPEVVVEEEDGDDAVSALGELMPFAADVCMIVETGVRYADLSVALAVVQHGQTIKMLADHVYHEMIDIDSKKVTFDLNGKRLDVVSTDDPYSFAGLLVRGADGELNLLDPKNGELNVTGLEYGVYVWDGGLKATVTNATAVGDEGLNESGVYVDAGEVTVLGNVSCFGDGEGVYAISGKVTVGGNVFAENGTGVCAYGSGCTIKVSGNVTTTGADAIGAWARSGNATITIDGAIYSAGRYVRVNAVYKNQNENDSDPSPYYLKYLNGTAVVWVAKPGGDAVCEIVDGGRYGDIGAAIAAVPPGSEETIRLLKSSKYLDILEINNKDITLDLNGKTLEVVSTGMGLSVMNGGSLTLADPYNGAFSVTGGTDGGVIAESNCKAEVTYAGASQGSGYAVQASGAGSEITVFGNVVHSGANGTGVMAWLGGKVTVKGDVTVKTGKAGKGAVVGDGGSVVIDGKMTIPSGAAYIWSNGETRGINNFMPDTDKPGYREYNINSGKVWVKGPKTTFFCEVLKPNEKYGDKYPDLDSALAAVGTGAANARTIKLLQNINYNKRLYISNKNITFDLNGKNLIVVNKNGFGLEVVSSGRVLLADPYDGVFSVTSYLNAIRANMSGKAEVTYVEVTGNGSGGTCVDAAGNSEITVFGDVKHTQSSGGLGINATGNSKVTVKGNLTIKGGIVSLGVSENGASEVTIEGRFAIPPEASYMVINDKDLDIGDCEPVSSKPGYREYTDTIGTGKVWVKDPDAKPVCVMGGEIYYGLFDAFNAVPDGDEARIKILCNHNEEYWGEGYFYTIKNKEIYLNLNGKTLSIENTFPGSPTDPSVGLCVNNAKLLLGTSLENGELNIAGGTTGIRLEQDAMAVVSNVKTTSKTIPGPGVDVRGESFLLVDGDVSVSHSLSEGVIVSGGGFVDITGTMSVANDDIYVQLGSTVRAKGTGKSDYLPGYLTYTDSLNPEPDLTDNTVIVSTGPIQCIISDMSGIRISECSLEAALAAVPVYDGTDDTVRTITLLKNVTYNKTMLINNQNIIFDLNGYTLDVVPDSDNGLIVANSSVTLAEPVIGEFNVSGGLNADSSGVSMVDDSFAMVSNVTARGLPNGFGVYAQADCAILVLGDIVVKNGTSEETSAVVAVEGAGVEVRGSILGVRGDACYAKIDSESFKNLSRFEPSSFGGYLEFISDAPFNTLVRVKDPAAAPVCSIDGQLYYDFYRAWMSAQYQNNKTIKLMNNILVKEPLGMIPGRNITLDLNGYMLNVDASDSTVVTGGLGLAGGCSLKLLDPYNGEFNVTGAPFGVIMAGGNNKAEVSSVHAKTRGSSAVYGITLSELDEVTVYGDVTVETSASTGGVGIFFPAPSKGKCTVQGRITVTGGSNTHYIGVGIGEIDQDCPEPISTKQGFLMYTNTPLDPTAADAATVWVRDPYSFAPVTGISGGPAEMTAGVPLTLPGSAVPYWATNRGIVWTVLNAGVTGAVISGNVLTASKAGIAVVRAAVANGLGEGEHYTRDFAVSVNDPPVSLVSVSPSHAILAYAGDGAKFTVSLAPGEDLIDNYAKIVWSVSDPALTISPAFSNKTATVYAADLTVEKTVTVTAKYDGAHIATATVEILPDVGDLNISLLEKAATVNIAKEIGALVPVLITKQNKTMFGIQSAGVSAFGNQVAAGSSFIEYVRMESTKNTLNELDADIGKMKVKGYSAFMYNEDDRYIEIRADSSAKNTTVNVYLKPAGNPEVFAGTMKLTAVTKYPKITLKAGSPNLAFPSQAVALTATSTAGECTITGFTAPANTIIWQGGQLKLAGRTKTGTVKATVDIEVAGYKNAYKKAPTINVKVVNTLPKLKLATKTVALLHDDLANDTAKIKLVTSNKKFPFESGYKIANVTCVSVNAKGKAVAVHGSHIGVSYGGGVINISHKPGCPTGKSALLKVSFVNSSQVVYLPLKIKVVPVNKLTASSKVKTVTVNSRHQSGVKIADIPINLNAANHSITDWYCKVNGAAIHNAILAVPGRNSVSLYVRNQKELEDIFAPNGKPVKLPVTITHGDVNYKNIKVTLTATKNAPSVTIAAKGKIDVANPASAIKVTVKTKNTASNIASVALLAGSAPSADFKAFITGGKTFNILAARQGVQPGVAQKITVKVTLENGISQNRALTIKPAQTAGKAALSKKTVTLYKAMPQSGDKIGIRLTKPANAQVGAVRLEQKSLNALKLTKDGAAASNGFRIARSGAGNWTVYFADEFAPMPKGKIAKNLKASYTIKLEIWTVGTYVADTNGDFVAPLKNAKPTYVNLKVNLK